MKKMILKIEDLEERIAPGVLVLDVGAAPGQVPVAGTDAANGDLTEPAPGGHGAADNSGIITS